MPVEKGPGSAGQKQVRWVRLAQGLAALAMAGVALCAQAEDSTASDAQALTEVTVTATRAETGTKTQTPLTETPQSISVVTEAQMSDQAVQNVDQALRYTSGVLVETRGAAATREDFQYLRGFGPFGSVYLDGMRQPYASFGFFQNEPYFIDRIEIFDGPASVLYGQNNPGGLVNLLSKRPTETAQGELFLSGGSFDRLEAGVDLSGPLDGQQSILYRLTAVALSSDTQVNYTESKRFAAAPAMTFRLDSATTLTVLTQYLHDPDGGYFGYVPAQGTFLPNPNGRIPRSFFDGDPDFNHDRRTQAAAGYELTHRFDAQWSVEQSLRYAHLDSDLALVYGTGLEPNLSTLDRSAFTDRDTIGALTLDNRLLGHFDTGALQHAVLVGVDYQHTDADSRWLFGAAPSLDVFAPVYGQPIPAPSLPLLNQRQVLDQAGVYFQDQARVGQWVLLGGVRHDWADTDTHDRTVGTTTDVNDTATTGRAGLVYLFDNGLAPYVSYSTSFEPTAGADWQGHPFVPTTGQQWEGGLKYQPPHVQGFLTASVFDLTEDNVLTPDPNPSHGPYAEVQTGRARAIGTELQGHLDLTSSLALIANFSHLDNRVVRSNGPDLGKEPVSVPKNTASAWAQYRLARGPVAGLALSAGVRYIGASFADTANTLRVPGFTVMDAGATYDFGRYRLALNVANLLDNDAVVCTNGAGSCDYIAARTVTASLHYRW